MMAFLRYPFLLALFCVLVLFLVIQLTCILLLFLKIQSLVPVNGLLSGDKVKPVSI